MRNFKKYIIFLGLALLPSCSLFLEKPDTTGTVDLDAIYSSKKNAEAVLMSCYGNILNQGWPGGMGLQDVLCGDRLCGR